MAEHMLRASVGVFFMALLMAPPLADCQSFWGYPGYNFGGGGAPSFGHRGYDRRSGAYGRHSDIRDDYSYGYPRCPPHENVETSRWRQLADGSAALQISLPGVHASNRRFSIGEDGQSLAVRAARPLPARGRACLPRDAEVSADGRHEILEKTLAVPEAFEASEATLHNKGNAIVEIRVPPKRRRTQQAEAQQQQQRWQQPSYGNGAEGAPHRPRSPRQDTAAFAAPAAAAAGKAPPRAAAATVPKSPVQLPSKPANLPPSDGIEVVDEDWPADPKAPDAAEGWFDNRGEFQSY